MKRTLLIAIALLGWLSAHAQTVTYNHSETKMNQVTVMETGAGALTPGLYYSTLHNSYQKTASEKNKLRYRTEAGAAAFGQVSTAEKIDSSITSRARIESLNMTDREVDLAWQAEGPKIEAKMEMFKKNISRITTAGGNASDRERWLDYYKLYQTAIKATRESYMPNAQRKREYLHIYDDLTRQNEALVGYIALVSNRTNTSKNLSATFTRPDHNGMIAEESRNRWRENLKSNTVKE